MNVSARSRRHLTWAAASTVVFLSACGLTNVPGTSAGSPARTASASPAATPTISQDVPDASRLTASNCWGPLPNVDQRPLDRYFTVRLAPNWTLDPVSQLSEITLIELTAPSAYGFAPTYVQFNSLIGPVHLSYGADATAHSIAAALAKEWSTTAIAGPVSDCHVAGESAAVFGASGDLNTASGTTNGKFFWIYFVHNDALFEVMLVGTGGISSQANQDLLGMLGSITWTF